MPGLILVPNYGLFENKEKVGIGSQMGLANKKVQIVGIFKEFGPTY
jgi:hypothetical protein